MTQYYENFGGKTSGVPPAGWTDRWVNTGTYTRNVVDQAWAVGGKLVRYTGTDGSRRALTRDDVDADANRGDGEVLVRFAVSTVEAITYISTVRAAGTATTSTQNGYVLRLNGAGILELIKLSAGNATILGSKLLSAPFIQAGMAYWARLRANGTTISGKLWPSGTTEPVGWDISVTDASFSIGSIGIAAFNYTLQDYDVVSIGTAGDTAAFSDTTPTTTSVEVSQLDTTIVLTAPSADLELSQFDATVIYNFPSANVNVSQADVTYVEGGTRNNVEVSQLDIMVVYRGKVYDPSIKAWTYTQDGHDFYVLRLGDTRTLVYDLATQQWSWFTSGDKEYWRPNLGMNWYDSAGLAKLYGSNVVAGDDSFGHIWVLNPEQGYDDDPREPPGSPLKFPRIATGQVIARQRISLPVDQVYLTANAGTPAFAGDTVELSYSDDVGENYVSAGSITVNTGAYDQQFAWRSLGIIKQPGRLFRISDYGAFARIDGLDCKIRGLE